MFARMTTTDEVEAYRDETRKDFPDFAVNVNRWGLHVRCPECGSSHTLNPESWMLSHREKCQKR